MSCVSIVRCESYEPSLVEKAVREACISAGMPDVQDKTILLKPNILSDSKEELGITTHSQVVRSVIRFLKEQGAKRILIGDSPGLHTPNFRPRASGIWKVIQEEEVEWADFTDHPTTYTIPYSRNKKLPLPSLLEEVDLLFSLPKMKTHQLMYATGAIKNLFGLVPNLHKSPCHLSFPTREQFASLMVGIATVAKASFALMDGVIAMEGPGPANGLSLPIGLILASKDLVALDYAQAEIMGYNPIDVPIVAEGLKRGLGKAPSEYPNLKAHDLVKTDYKRIDVQKKTRFFHALILPFFAGPFVRWRVKRQRKAPLFLEEACILCKKCIQICPVDALQVEKKHVVIDENRCIRCYCCHEVCPASAILVDEEIPS